MANPKEPYFFELDKEFENGLDSYYENYFSHREDEAFIGDARHRNFYLPWVSKRITRTFPDAKYLVILRNPVERAYSHYLHWYRSGREGTETLPFSDAIFQNFRRLRQGANYDNPKAKKLYQQYFTDFKRGPFRSYLDSGYYYKQIKRYLDQDVPLERFKIVIFENFIKNQQKIADEIFEFLGLESCPVESSRTHAGWSPKSLTLQQFYSSGKNLLRKLNLYSYFPQNLIGKLQSFNQAPKENVEELTNLWLYHHYESHNDDLRKLTGQKLEHWSFDPEDYENTPDHSTRV